MRKVVLLFFLFGCIVSYGQISFVPASPYPITVKQPDGTSINILARGDEYNHYSITEDGYSVVKNELGIYEYAVKDYIGQLRASGIKANNTKSRLSNEVNYINTISKNISPTVSPISKILKSATSSERPQHAFPSSGNRRVLMLLIEYPDLGNTHSLQDFDNLMNQANYNSTGSFNDYYKTYSNNTLDITVDVFGWYASTEDYLYYGEDNGDDRARGLVREAVDAAEAAGIDFSQYDNDGNNVLDNLMVVHSGPGAEEGSQIQYVWSHSWGLNDLAVIYDGVLVNSYVIQP